MNKLNTLIAIGIAFLLVVLNTACEKQEIFENTQNSKLVPSKTLRTFASQEELENELNNLNSLSLEELSKYEEQIGFNSFGKVAEVIYHSYCDNEEELDKRTREEIIEYFNNNSDYIHIITEADGSETAETKYWRSAYYYVMNADCMVIVGDLAYKVFENGYVKCNKSYIDKLKKMNEEDFLVIPTNDDIYYAHKYCNNIAKQSGNWGDGDVWEKVSGDGKEKVKMWLEYESSFQSNYGRVIVTTKGYRKTAGVFFGALRHITNNVGVTIHFPDGTTETKYETTATSDTEFSLRKELDFRFCWVGSYISAVNGWFQIPAVRYTFPN